MTKHGGNEESRVHLRSMIGSEQLLARLSHFHAPVQLIQSNSSYEPVTATIPSECFESFTSSVKARLGFAPLRVTGRELLRIVARFYDLTVGELKGPRRTKHITRARFAFYLLASKTLQLTNAQIARLVARDVSTVHNGLWVFDNQLSRITKDPQLAVEIEQIGLTAAEQFGVYDEAAAE